MPPDHNQQQSRRPHYHRGRRGPDRRGGDRRPPPQQTEPANRDQLDVEQIMREIRARISDRHGIDLTGPQIQELAARRLEAILDPGTVKPALMDELRRAAGLPAEAARPAPEGEARTIDESVLYDSGSGLLRGIRRLLNGLLKLFINPAAIVDALNAQAGQVKASADREAEQRRRQSEWNALHFEILRRLVTDIARMEIDNQHLAQRVESLAARVDYNDRRVAGLEQAQHQTKPVSRGPDGPVTVAPVATARSEAQAADHVASETSAEGGRRRRRRRRGRRPGGGQPREVGGGAPLSALGEGATPEQAVEGDDFGDEDGAAEYLEETGAASTPSRQSVDAGFEAPRTPEESLRVAQSEPEAPSSNAEGLHRPEAPRPVEPSEPGPQDQ